MQFIYIVAVDGHIGIFQLLAIMNSAAMGISVDVLLWHGLLLDIYLRLELFHYSIYMHYFNRNPQEVFQFSLLPIVHESSICFTSLPTLGIDSLSF